MVFGRVFTRPSADHPIERDTLRDEKHVRAIVDSCGDLLLSERWGQYVAFLADDMHTRQYVVRDPSGGVRCFFLTHEDILTCFTNIEDPVSLGFPPPSINWKYVAGFLIYSRLQIEETGFEGITELHAGARLTREDSCQSVGYAWNPSKIICDHPKLRFEQASTLAALALSRCTNVMAAQYRRVVHRLSGGLDSSVVLDALLQSPSNPVLFCENHYSASAPEGDERIYARLAAQAFGISLKEIAFPRNAPALERLENIPVTARPSASLLSFQHDFILALAREHGVDAFTNGHGGDQVFCNYSGPLLAADYAIDNGLDSPLLHLIRGIAGNGHHSAWSIWAAIIRHAYAGARYEPMRRLCDNSGPLTNVAREAVPPDYILPAWLSQCQNLPPAKLMHVLMIADLQVYNEMTIEHVVADTPLLLAVQPLVEICLRTPTYVLGCNGADRAVERSAFASRLPRAIVNRHAKGDTTRYFANMLSANLRWLRPFLLDGVVAHSGVVERNTLANLLTTQSLVRRNVSTSLISCLIAEAWVRGSRRLSASAAAQDPVGIQRAL